MPYQKLDQYSHCKLCLVRTLCWVQDATLRSERYLGFKTLPWVQNVYLGCRTLPWVQNATLGSERYLRFRTLPWVQDATLGSERYLRFRMLPWVHYESSEEVRPRDVVHGILFRGDSSSNNLSIHVICQHLEKTKHHSGKLTYYWH